MIPLHLQNLVDHFLEGVAGMTREGHLEASVETLLEEVHLLLLKVYLTRSIPHHASEAVGVLLDLLGSLGNVAELFHLAFITPSGMWCSWKALVNSSHEMCTGSAWVSQ